MPVMTMRTGKRVMGLKRVIVTVACVAEDWIEDLASIHIYDHHTENRI